ncbi:Protein CBR-HPO-5 [Caenorhabditis briggsae]|uniref:Protein CBR-HPO-5 n=1 Tax=Caenorhabditis briggsae TaxID=6238 RepID=A8WUZ8_CAEBR|nr:Protein CBR-HPO-5 [Caenorhabditis briggsae]CAP24309.2 Protein CBR-HPO-5 [Caenorhabditis briggsae]
MPMWYLTTSTYRAPFPTFPANRSITVEVRINFAIASDEMGEDVQKVMPELEYNMTTKEVVAPLDFQWRTRFIGVRKFDDLERDHSLKVEEKEEFFDVFICLVSEKVKLVISKKHINFDFEDWKHYSATRVQLGIGKWNFVQWPEKSEEKAKASSRITELVSDTLIDVPHLNSIVRRDLRQKMQPWQIAALPLSHQKRLVWDSAPLATNYHIQVIHLHENTEIPTESLEQQKRTAAALRKFAEKVQGVTRVDVSIEHLWDFEPTTQFLAKDVQERWTLTHSAMEELIKKVDAQMQTSLVQGTVLRFVVLETSEPVVVLDETGEDIDGVAVASWGAVLPRNEATESKAIAAMRIQMGMDAELLIGWHRPSVALCQWEVARARLRASVDNAMRAASAVRALDELAHKISNIAINDDVAGRATRAVNILDEVVRPGKRLDFESLLEARRLADSANYDHSLLAMLYFPMDQRTAVLIPLAVPIVLPICKLIFEISMEGQRTQVPEGGELVCYRNEENQHLFLKVEYSRETMIKLSSSILCHQRPTGLKQIAEEMPELLGLPHPIPMTASSPILEHSSNHKINSYHEHSPCHLFSPVRGPVTEADEASRVLSNQRELQKRIQLMTLQEELTPRRCLIDCFDTSSVLGI